MSRVAQDLKSKIVVGLVAIVVIAAGVGGGLYIHHKDSGDVQTVSNSAHQLTQISYDGQQGISAYTLLKKHATVKAQYYSSLGYFVTTINGSVGNGPKYWTFYVNGKESSVGASSYITKNSDKIVWKLQ